MHRFHLILCFHLATITILTTESVAQTSAPISTRTYPEISAHRGAPRIAPENTLASFRKAIELGADFIEIDVRTTADGKQVCLHDGSLRRTTGFDGKVSEQRFKSIRKLSAGSWFDQAFEREKIPTLEETCRLVASHNRSAHHYVKLYVDCKDIRPGRVIRTLDRYDLLDSAVFYGDPATLRTIREMAPTARLLAPYEPSLVASITTELHPYAFDIAWSELTEEVVRNCHAKGIKAFCDLLDDDDHPTNYREAIRRGVDLIQTDAVVSVQDCIRDLATSH